MCSQCDSKLKLFEMTQGVTGRKGFEKKISDNLAIKMMPDESSEQERNAYTALIDEFAKWAKENNKALDVAGGMIAQHDDEISVGVMIPMAIRARLNVLQTWKALKWPWQQQAKLALGVCLVRIQALEGIASGMLQEAQKAELMLRSGMGVVTGPGKKKEVLH